MGFSLLTLRILAIVFMEKFDLFREGWKFTSSFPLF